MDAGNIYFIPDFVFEDGGISNKILIVICVDDVESVIINALPTSQDKCIPVDEPSHGCTRNHVFSFFMFEKGRIVGEEIDGSDFAFRKNTFVIVRDNVRMLKISSLLQYHGQGFKHIGCLATTEFNRLIKCIRGSKHLARNVKRKLETVLGE